MTAEEKARDELALAEGNFHRSQREITWGDIAERSTIIGWNAHAAWAKAAASSSGEAGEFPPRLLGAEIPGSGGKWAAMSDMAPPDYASFEFLSKKEHEALLLAGRASLRVEMEELRETIRRLAK